MSQLSFVALFTLCAALPWSSPGLGRRARCPSKYRDTTSCCKAFFLPYFVTDLNYPNEISSCPVSFTLVRRQKLLDTPQVMYFRKLESCRFYCKDDRDVHQIERDIAIHKTKNPRAGNLRFLRRCGPYRLDCPKDNICHIIGEYESYGICVPKPVDVDVQHDDLTAALELPLVQVNSELTSFLS